MNLQIANIGIKQDDQGRYCLNDLHRAAGSEKRHQPSNWLMLKQTSELIEELSITGITGIETKQGLGTFVAKQLVYAYAMWISPAFHLKVINTFDAVSTTPAVQDPSTRALIQLLTEQDQLKQEQGQLKQRVSVIEAKQTTRDESYFTAAGFCNLKGIKLDRAGMAMIGKMAAGYSRDNGIKIGKVYDSRYGEVNEYHVEALQYAVQA